MSTKTVPTQLTSHGMDRVTFFSAALLLLLLLPASELLAQRITYEYLRVRDRQPTVFIEHLVVPDTARNGMQLITTFRLENNFLTFRRLREETSGEQVRRFFAEPSVQVSAGKRGADAADRDRTTQTVTGNWSETIYAETYEQTRSATTYLQDMLTGTLEPGTYHMESVVRSNSRSRRVVTPSMRIATPDDTDMAYFYFLDNAEHPEPPFSVPLMNMGHNVYFGRDHQLLVWIPAIDDRAGYALEIDKLRISRQDTTVRKQVLAYSMEPENMLRGMVHEIAMSGERPQLTLRQVAGDTRDMGAFYVLTVPNSTFENAAYRIRVLKRVPDREPKVIARRTYQSLWLDMPVSLLNLDVAINMMRFVVDDDQHRELRRGNRQQREERFRRFWAERDPSPEKEYNELMVEYFRRIDYAFENFSTPQSPGYDSDQGRVYIRQGAPDQRERKFPPGQPAREVWHYADRAYVFEATTGFGDYRLIDRR